jgi:hypothetical protein
MAVSITATVILACLLAGAAWAGGGGTTIASAPELPLGQTIVDGDGGNAYQYGLFWRVTLATGDRLILDYAQTEPYFVHLKLFKPTVTDYTLNNASAIAYNQTGQNGKGEFVWVASGAGRWIVNFLSDAATQLGYQAIAYVQRFTSVSLQTPPLVAVGQALRVTGSVNCASGGKIALQITATKQKPITAVVPLSSTGAFSWTSRLRAPGVYRVAAIYYGDRSHRSSKTARVVHAA